MLIPIDFIGAEIEPGIFDVYNETNYESPHLNATRQNLTQPLWNVVSTSTSLKIYN